jgi:formylglycine-generating enzyme required for sulfatase activity
MSTTNSANWNGDASWDEIAIGGAPGWITTVGSNGGSSFYSTYDQTGNVSEWTDGDEAGQIRSARGGSFYTTSNISSNSKIDNLNVNDLDTKITLGLGFRVASLSNPFSFSNFVLVGDSSNTADNNGYGSVNYGYYIGKYTVTVCEYVEFLNSVAATDLYELYSPGFSTGGIIRSGSIGNYTYSSKANYDNKPAGGYGGIGWLECARYCNWLHNNKPVGPQNNDTTEDGAYTLNGAVSSTNYLLWNYTPQKNIGAKYYIPTENEWYKAAYYKGNGANSGYWLYATQSDSTPWSVSASVIGDGPISSLYFCSAGPTPTPTPTICNTNSFIVDPKLDFIDTGIELTTDTVFNVFAKGSIVVDSIDGSLYGDPIDPNGAPFNDTITSYPIGALLGRIDDNYFLLGSSYSGVPPVNGRLYIGVYDRIRSDNSGNFFVDISFCPITTPTPAPTEACNVCFRMACESDCSSVVSVTTIPPTPTPTKTPGPTPTPTKTPTPTPTKINYILKEILLVDELNLNNQALKIEINDNTNKLYAMSYNKIFTIDISSWSITNITSTDMSNFDIAIDKNNNKLYILGTNLKEMDLNTNVLHTFSFFYFKPTTYIPGLGLEIKLFEDRLYFITYVEGVQPFINLWFLFTNPTDHGYPLGIDDAEQFLVNLGDGFPATISVASFDVDFSKKIAYVALGDTSWAELITRIDFSSENEFGVPQESGIVSYHNFAVINPRDILVDSSASKIYFANGNTIEPESKNTIYVLDTTENNLTLYDSWGHQGINNPNVLALNKNKNKMYIGCQYNISVYDTITGLLVLNVNMPINCGFFRDVKITNSGRVCSVYCNRIFIFNNNLP